MSINLNAAPLPVRPVGLLTEAEHQERHTQMRRLAAAVFPVSNHLNAALGGLLPSAVLGLGPGISQDPEYVRQETRVDIKLDQGIEMNVTLAFIMSSQYIAGASDAISMLIEGQVAKAKMRIVHEINVHMTDHGHPEMIPAITQIMTQQAEIITNLQALETSETRQSESRVGHISLETQARPSGS